MSARVWMLALGVTACAGCAQWDAEARARDRARGWLDCETIELTRYSEHAWRAEGCGQHVDVACTTADNEPECIRVRFPAAVVAAETGAETEAEIEAETETGTETGAGGAETGVGAEAEGVASAGGEVGAAEAAIRAALDAARGDVLACVSRERAVVRATWDAAGAVSLTLEGDLAGSAEEGCVRAALSHVRAPEGVPGTLLHLVR